MKKSISILFTFLFLVTTTIFATDNTTVNTEDRGEDCHTETIITWAPIGLGISLPIFSEIEVCV